MASLWLCRWGPSRSLPLSPVYSVHSSFWRLWSHWVTGSDGRLALDWLGEVAGHTGEEHQLSASPPVVVFAIQHSWTLQDGGCDCWARTMTLCNTLSEVVEIKLIPASGTCSINVTCFNILDNIGICSLQRWVKLDNISFQSCFLESIFSQQWEKQLIWHLSFTPWCEVHTGPVNACVLSHWLTSCASYSRQTPHQELVYVLTLPRIPAGPLVSLLRPLAVFKQGLSLSLELATCA